VTGQSWDPDLYARNARFVSDLGMPVVALLDPRPGERILDLGCGDGVLTEKLAALGCEVVGADASPAQVEAARARGLDAPGLGEVLGARSTQHCRHRRRVRRTGDHRGGPSACRWFAARVGRCDAALSGTG